MNSHWINVTSEIKFGDLSVEEIMIILQKMPEISSISIRENNIVHYGNDNDIKISFNKKSTKILKIEIKKDYWKNNKAKIQEIVNTAQVIQSHAICTDIVFSAGPAYFPNFKWKDQFQIGEVPDGNPEPPYSDALYPQLFQYKISKTGIPWLDAYRHKKDFKKYFLPLLPILKQYCQTRILYHPYLQNSWMIVENTNTDNMDFNSQYLQSGYVLKSKINPSDFHEYQQFKAKQLPTSTFDHYWLEGFNISNTYCVYEDLPKDEKEKFLIGCEWLNKAIIANDPTDQFLFIMIMLETFLPNDSEQCSECGQKKYSINKKFKTYIPEIIGEKWTEDFDKLLNQLYSLRSSISHQGSTISSGLKYLPYTWEQECQLRRLFNIGNQFLISWLGHQQKKLNKPQRRS